MHSFILKASALFAALAAAQTTTPAPDSNVLQVFLLDTDSQSLVASIISADATATEFLMGCPPDTDANDCGYNPPVTVKKQHRSNGDVWGASLTRPEEQFTYSYDCTLTTTGDVSGVCVTSAGGEQANFPGVETTTIGASEITFYPVTVTAGQEELGAAASATGSASGSGGVLTLSGTKSSSSGAASGSGSASGSAASASASSTNGADAMKIGAGGVLGLAGLLALL